MDPASCPRLSYCESSVPQNAVRPEALTEPCLVHVASQTTHERVSHEAWLAGKEKTPLRRDLTYTKGSLTETTKTLPASLSLGELM